MKYVWPVAAGFAPWLPVYVRQVIRHRRKMRSLVRIHREHRAFLATLKRMDLGA